MWWYMHMNWWNNKRKLHIGKLYRMQKRGKAESVNGFADDENRNYSSKVGILLNTVFSISGKFPRSGRIQGEGMKLFSNVT